MKATLSKNYKFIQLSERPICFSADGFKIYHNLETKTELPISTCNLIAGKNRYYLHRLPKKLRETIYKLEIKQGDTWIVVPLTNNNLQ